MLLADLTAECIDAAVDAVMSRFDLPWSDAAFHTIEAAVRDDAPQLAIDALAEVDLVFGLGRDGGLFLGLNGGLTARPEISAPAHCTTRFPGAR